MHRLPDELLRRTEFDHAPEVHYAYAPFPREVLGDREVVGNEQERHPELLLQPQQHVEQPDAQRDVHHRDRLIGHDELGVYRERPGDGDALALPARELVGMLLQEFFRGRQPDRLEQLVDPALELGARLHELVAPQGRAQDLRHVAYRVQRGESVSSPPREARRPPCRRRARGPAKVRADPPSFFLWWTYRTRSRRPDTGSG